MADNPHSAYIPPHTLEAMANMGCKHGRDPDHFTRAMKVGMAAEPDDRPDWAKRECSECQFYQVMPMKPWKGYCAKGVKQEVRHHEVACKRFRMRRNK